MAGKHRGEPARIQWRLEWAAAKNRWRYFTKPKLRHLIEGLKK